MEQIRQMSVWRAQRFQLALLAGLASAAPVWAAIPPDMSLGQCVARLNDPDLQVRNTETEALTTDNKYTLQQIESLLKDPTLPAEVRLRLLPIARAKFDDQPRAALGVRFKMGTNATLIENVMVNFPASGVLKPGDEIVAVEGININDPISANSRQEGRNGNGNFNGQFGGNGQGNFFFGGSPIRPHIIGQDPGSTVRIKVIRRGEAFLRNRGFVIGPGGEMIMDQAATDPRAPRPEIVELDVPLGKYADLHDPQGLLPQHIEQSWQLRTTTKRLNPENEPLASGLQAADFGSQEMSDMNRAADLTSRTRQGRVLPIAAGGEPRAVEPQVQVVENGNSMRIFNGNLADPRRLAGPNAGFEIRIGNGGKLPNGLPRGLPNGLANELVNGLPGIGLVPELNLGDGAANKQIALIRKMMMAQTSVAELSIRLNIIDANPVQDAAGQKQQALERRRIADELASKQTEIEKLTAQLFDVAK